ncbi:MAG TPA: aminomethyl-transferring glycine dehydrogenase subunit GcvPA [bacterium]|nr:aminomethyl-transferring glycine dehydrogenase subunit GcvPA [bacterium]HPN43637.1 aminomethyl-transferring glycine dehydrogenase subunit GcvPA [bacterium]
MGFIPNTDADQQQMLNKIGVRSFAELIGNIPGELLFKGELKLPVPLSEMEVLKHLNDLAGQNANCEDHICFLGGGAYDHFIPAAVKHIISRSEFYTAYTPYQPEVSQGTLQAIYEFQTMICELTGMDVANASVYDGGSALAEAMLLACGFTGRKEILIAATINPSYLQVIKTYSHGRGIVIRTIDWQNGAMDLQDLEKHISDQTAAVIVQYPNYFGYLEEVDTIAQLTHKNGALFITSNDPISLALLEPPGVYGADIVTGEGQVLGNPISFGGPYLGLFAAKKDLIRYMPGRIVGQTEDKNGKTGYVLTLQTREQHIRREKATSNICTNQGLNALAATVYMSLMGKNGLPAVAHLCLQKSHYLAQRLSALKGLKLKFDRPWFKEFVVELESKYSVNNIINKMLEKKVFAGISLQETDKRLGNCILVTVTEKRTKEEMDYYIKSMQELLQ